MGKKKETVLRTNKMEMIANSEVGNSHGENSQIHIWLFAIPDKNIRR